MSCNYKGLAPASSGGGPVPTVARANFSEEVPSNSPDRVQQFNPSTCFKPLYPNTFGHSVALVILYYVFDREPRIVVTF